VITESEPQLPFANLQDATELFELMQLSALTLQAQDHSTEQIQGALGTVFGVDTQLIDDQTYFAVATNQRIVACGGWSKRQTLFGGDANKQDGPDALLDPAHDAARIRAFFVHPQFARQGLGSLLITHCEAAAIKAGFQRMELVATLSGERLYAQAGYRPMKRFSLELVNKETLPVVSMGKALAKNTE